MADDRKTMMNSETIPFHISSLFFFIFQVILSISLINIDAGILRAKFEKSKAKLLDHKHPVE